MEAQATLSLVVTAPEVIAVDNGEVFGFDFPHILRIIQ